VDGQTRNHSVTAIAMLAGAAAVGFGALQPWAAGSADVPVGRPARDRSLGFDVLLGPSGTYEDVRPLILGGATFLALAGLLLMVTRMPRVGVLWRILGLAAVTGTGGIAASAWAVVQDPPLVIAAGESTTATAHVTSTVQLGSLLEFSPGVGLWLVTIGCGTAALGALIPATRRSGLRPAPHRPARRRTVGLSRRAAH
jgi:hypothetical protein